MGLYCTYHLSQNRLQTSETVARPRLLAEAFKGENVAVREHAMGYFEPFIATANPNELVTLIILKIADITSLR